MKNENLERLSITIAIIEKGCIPQDYKEFYDLVELIYIELEIKGKYTIPNGLTYHKNGDITL